MHNTIHTTLYTQHPIHSVRRKATAAFEVQSSSCSQSERLEGDSYCPERLGLCGLAGYLSLPDWSPVGKDDLDIACKPRWNQFGITQSDLTGDAFTLLKICKLVYQTKAII